MRVIQAFGSADDFCPDLWFECL